MHLKISLSQFAITASDGQTLADPEVRFGGGGGRQLLAGGPNPPPFSTFSPDLGHFILKLLNFDHYFLFHFYCFYSFWSGPPRRLGLGEGG